MRITLAFLPYFVTLGNIPKYLSKLQTAGTPEKFDIKFMKEVLGFKSNNDQRLIKILKSMEFLDPSGIPLKRYHDFRAEGASSLALASGIRTAYQPLFKRNVNAHTASEEEIKGYVISITGKPSDNDIVRLITASFIGLGKHANWKSVGAPTLTEEDKKNLPKKFEPPSESAELKLSYTIVLNLPATTTKEVYDTLFASLKENLLKS